MDLRQLKYFIAVAEERNISRAAKRLHLSQPPLTRQIRVLEDSLGVLLFTRSALGMELTQAGHALLNDARNLRQLAEQAGERAQRAGRGETGRLDVGLYGSAIFDVVPKILSAFAQRHPDVDLALHAAQTPAQVGALRQGRVLLVFERQLPNESDIEVELVAQEPIMVGVHARHRLAARKSIAMEDLQGEPIIMPTAPSSQLANVSLELCRAHGFEPKLAPLASDVVTGAVLAACGMGSFLAPAAILNMRIPNLVCLPLKSRVPAFMALHCYYLKGEQPPLLAALLETVREYRRTQGRVGPTTGARKR